MTPFTISMMPFCFPLLLSLCFRVSLCAGVCVCVCVVYQPFATIRQRGVGK
jgi:hypothetical protein